MAKRSTGRRKSAGRPAAAAARATTPDDRVIDAALKLAAAKGWRRTTLADIAAESGLSLAELYSRFRSKASILEAFIRRVDRATLEGADKPSRDDETSVRDRLFELIMRRLDALEPHKAAVAALQRELAFRPLAALCAGGRLCRSMAWVASVAGIPTTGPLGMLRVQGLTALYAYVLRVWLRDETEDHAKTMAALDKALQRAEMFAQSAPAPLKRA